MINPEIMVLLREHRDVGVSCKQIYSSTLQQGCLNLQSQQRNEFCTQFQLERANRNSQIIVKMLTFSGNEIKRRVNVFVSLVFTICRYCVSNVEKDGERCQNYEVWKQSLQNKHGELDRGCCVLGSSVLTILLNAFSSSAYLIIAHRTSSQLIVSCSHDEEL